MTIRIERYNMGNIKNLVGIVLFSLISSGCSRVSYHNFDDAEEKPRAKRFYLPYIEFRADVPEEKNLPYDIREIQKGLEIYRVPPLRPKEKSTTKVEYINDIERDKLVRYTEPNVNLGAKPLPSFKIDAPKTKFPEDIK